MFPQIIETTNLDNVNYYAFNTGHIVCGFELDGFDFEISNLDDANNNIAQFLGNLSPDVTAKFYLKSEIDRTPIKTQREFELPKIGYVKNSFYLMVTIKENSISSVFKMMKSKQAVGSFDVLALKLKNSFDMNTLNQCFKIHKLSEDGFHELLPKINRDYIEKISTGVDLGTEIRGYVRLRKLTPNTISMATLANIKDALPLPYNLIVNVQKIPQEKSENLLRIKTNQTEIQTDRVGNKKYQETQEKLDAVKLGGGSLLNFEFIVEISRYDEKTIREQAEKIIQMMIPIGEFYFETVGAYQNFLCTQPNGEIHVPQIELNQILPCFLPLTTYGDQKSIKNITPHALSLHRLDQSLTHFDIFNPSYDNFSLAVIGLSGRGKSYWLNLFTRSIMNNPDIRVIKLDVGGSHSKETELMGEAEYELTLDRPSGINPLFVLSNMEVENLDYINLIITFLKTLLLEQSEVSLTKDMTADLEQAVKAYAATKPKVATIDDFLDKTPDIPRRKLLERWSSKGTYKNAFKVSGDTSQLFNKRLKYYNLQQVFQASDPDFGQGALAAVMSQFNIEMMKIAEENKRTGSQKKIVFIADETPFFIKRSFDFFKFSTANVRKYGGSFVTTVQKSSDLVVNDDAGVIENSATKILFSVDGDAESYGKRLKIDPELVKKIGNLKTVKGEYSDAMLVDAFGSRVMRTMVTKNEHWNFTSSASDKSRLQELRAAVPSLNLEEALSCLKLL